MQGDFSTLLRAGMHGMRTGERGFETGTGDYVRTFFASWANVEYFWMAVWIAEWSVSLKSVMRRMAGMVRDWVGLEWKGKGSCWCWVFFVWYD